MMDEGMMTRMTEEVQMKPGHAVKFKDYLKREQSLQG